MIEKLGFPRPVAPRKAKGGEDIERNGGKQGQENAQRTRAKCDQSNGLIGKASDAQPMAPSTKRCLESPQLSDQRKLDPPAGHARSLQARPASH